jgi:hypothetical protein
MFLGKLTVTRLVNIRNIQYRGVCSVQNRTNVTSVNEKVICCHLLTLNLLCFRRNKCLYIDITKQDGTYQIRNVHCCVHKSELYHFYLHLILTTASANSSPSCIIINLNLLIQT